MSSLALISVLLLAVLIIRPCDATNIWSFFSAHSSARCRDNTDCIVGCICAGDTNGRCVSIKHMKKVMKKCKSCSSNRDCPEDIDGCSTLGVCATCTAKVVEEGAASCKSNSTSPLRNTQKKCASTAGCKNGCKCALAPNQCVEGRIAEEKRLDCKTCLSNDDCPSSWCRSSKICHSCWLLAALDGIGACHAEGTTANSTAARNSTAKPAPSNATADNSAPNNSRTNPCISTSWLQERGLEHAAIRHTGVANVVCIPDLPCGTSGHILRRCTNEECRLVTYREVCDRRGDCIESATAVSQLSHSFDWSQFKVDTNSEGATLELTSLSAHPLSGPSSPSRIVAYVSDRLNSMGLGLISNAVALFPHNARAFFQKASLSQLS